MDYVKSIRLFKVSQTFNVSTQPNKGCNTMKTLLIVLALSLTFVLAGQAVQRIDAEQNHSACLTQQDVSWHTKRSKSGIARTCNNEVLQQNLNQESSHVR